MVQKHMIYSFSDYYSEEWRKKKCEIKNSSINFSEMSRFKHAK